MKPWDRWTVLAAGATAAAALLLLLRRRKRPPPGPRALPFIGNMHNVTRPIFPYAYSEWRRLYGDVVSYRIGSRRFVVLNSYAAVKEALTSPEFADVFSGRVNNAYIHSITHGKGVVASEGALWREHRRFALKVLRDFGFARDGTEDAIRLELQDLREVFDANVGQPIDFSDKICRSIANVISCLLFGYRAGTQDARFDEFMRATQENLQGDGVGRFVPNAFPKLAKVPGLLRLVEMLGVDVFVIKRTVGIIHAFCEDQIQKHKRNLASVAAPNDFLDAFLLEQQKLERSGKPHTFDDFQLMRVLAELFQAGMDTTANTIGWAILYACMYPDCQEKLYKEIEAQIGTERLPEYKDRKDMPYALAYIEEVQRFATLAPFSVPHRCIQDVKFRGYDIGADDIVQVNLYGVHHDPQLWEQPDEFRPERFLSEDGEFRPSEHVVPFSVGRRVCLGEGLARQELFLFVVGLVQKHRVRLDPKCEPRLQQIARGTGGLVHAPGNHKVVFHKR